MRIRKSNLAILGGRPITTRPKPHFPWPVITRAIEKAVVKQLHTTISIYNRSGIFEEFEDAWAKYTTQKYALVGSSGTTSLLNMYAAAGITKGDEVICPAYTFFATVTPLLTLGALPILADCDENGNIDPDHVRSLITSRTKAVAVTHMWGIPAKIKALAKLCREKKLLLFEDCSHAHGARVDGKVLGSFGDAAVWSLQGPKTITGGEGGVMTTNNAEVYYKALLFGHYNKRCLQEIPKDHKLYRYGVTGMGLKLRAHPLAIAIAYEQFKHLEDWIRQKERFAQRLIAAADAGAPGALRHPILGRGEQAGWYGLVWRYNPSHLGGLKLERLVSALHAEGLHEFDIPKSTSPLNLLPLFQDPGGLLPQSNKVVLAYRVGQFPRAEEFYTSALKLPVWVSPKDTAVVNEYVRGLNKVLGGYQDLITAED